MGTRETRLHRGRRLGEQRVRALVWELGVRRVEAGLSQRTVAHAVGRSQAAIWRLEKLANISSVSLVELTEIGAFLGLELGANWHPAGAPIRDRAHQAVIARVRAIISSLAEVTGEVPFPTVGDPRAWDLLVRTERQRVGVEVETRIRDVQALSRRMHQRERDGGMDAIVLALNESAANRRLLAELLDSLGTSFTTPPRTVLSCLRRAVPLPGSGVILV